MLLSLFFVNFILFFSSKVIWNTFFFMILKEQCFSTNIHSYVCVFLIYIFVFKKKEVKRVTRGACSFRKNFFFFVFETLFFLSCNLIYNIYLPIIIFRRSNACVICNNKKKLITTKIFFFFNYVFVLFNLDLSRERERETKKKKRNTILILFFIVVKKNSPCLNKISLLVERQILLNFFAI